MTVFSVASQALSLLALSDEFFWESPIFRKDLWEPAMNGLRLLLTFVGALFLMYEMRAARLRERIPMRWKRNIALVFTLLAFGVYFDFFNPNTRYSEYYHRHELYHYYLGSKYFSEIGYKRLYECTAIAEIELGHGAAVRKRDIRDLRVNLIKPVASTYIVSDPDQCKKHFTTERWEDWKKDVDWFYKSSAGSYWDNMQKDHGYNPPPVWTMAGKFFGSFAPASDGFFKMLASIDVILHALIIVMFYWAFGWRVGAIATVFWGCNAPANFYWTGGAFLRQDWLFFLIASLCFTRKRKFFWAGVFLTWSALLRIFPGVFVLGWAIIIGIGVIKRIRFPELRTPPTRGPMRGLLGLLAPEHRSVIAGCAVALVTLVSVSIAVTGKDSYKQFMDHTIAVHNKTPLTNHMGLETMLVHDWDGRMRFLRDDNMEDPFKGWKQNRLDRFQRMKPLFIAIIAGLFAWTIWALRRTKLLWVGMAIAPALVMSLTNLTCYYYSMFLVCAALAKVRPQLGPPILITSGISSILLYSPRGFYWVDDRFTAQAWLFFALGCMLIYAYSRPFSMARLKAWWNNKPEPRTKNAPSPAPDVQSAT